MLMRDARLRRTWMFSGWMLVVLAAVSVPAGSVLAEEAPAPSAPVAAPTATAPAAVAVPTATVAAPPPAAVPTAPVAPTTGMGTGGFKFEGTADEAAATGYGDMKLPIKVAPYEIQRDWRTMIHFFDLARFDLAKAAAEKVLAAKPAPEMVLELVEASIPPELGMPRTGYDTMLAMIRVPDMGDIPSQLLTLYDEGARMKRTNPARIQGNLVKLGKGPMEYRVALKELAYSGPYVVPYALAMMQDPNQKELAQEIQRALVDIGQPVVLPLTRALVTPDTRLRERIVIMLGQINYPYALPSLKALIEDAKQPQLIKAAATRAILSMGNENVLKTPAKDLFLDLAERYLSGKVVVADMRQPTTDLFDWVPGTGLIYRAAPSQCISEILASRACTDALKSDPTALEAVSLWLTAMMEMEGKTPGKMARDDDPFLPEAMPSLDYFATAAGQQHLYRVLDRALRDHNTPIAVRACTALGKVANQGFLKLYGQADVGSPLVMALTYPDQRVRYAAAFALHNVRPNEKFTGHLKVVPTLIEALNLEAQKSILIVEPDADNRNRLQARYKEGGWNVLTATTGNQALSAARAMLRIDAILISSKTKDMGHGDLVSILRNDYETTLTPILVLSYPDDTIKATWLEDKIPYLKAVDPAGDTDAMVAEIDTLKKKSGSVMLDADAARAISLQAAVALKDIAMTNRDIPVSARVFSADRARQALLEALTGRPDELVIAAAESLAQMPDAEIEMTFAKIGTDALRSKPVRVATLKALDRSARTIGNKLDASQVAALQAMSAEGDDQLRDASGEALGGLCLDAAEATKLIMKCGDIASTATSAPAAPIDTPPPPTTPSTDVTPSTTPAPLPTIVPPSTTNPPPGTEPPAGKVTMPPVSPKGKAPTPKAPAPKK
jgi:CheY-like chemotaxis protein